MAYIMIDQKETDSPSDVLPYVCLHSFLPFQFYIPTWNLHLLFYVSLAFTERFITSSGKQECSSGQTKACNTRKPEISQCNECRWLWI